jgi:hypothetical protein
LVITPTAEEDAPTVIYSEDCGTMADVVPAGSGAVVPGGIAERGGTVVEGSGIDMAKSDTRLLCAARIEKRESRGSGGDGRATVPAALQCRGYCSQRV